MTVGNATDIGEKVAVARFLEHPGEHSFSELFLAVAPRLVRYFLHRRCSHAIAEELMLDVMHSAYREVSSLRDRDLFLPWLFTIARNRLTHHLRKVSREIHTLTLESAKEIADGTAGNESVLLSQSSFYDWLSVLPPQEQELLELRYLDELGYEEIAEALKIPLGTLKWRLYRSKKKLAARFKPPSTDRSI